MEISKRQFDQKTLVSKGEIKKQEEVFTKIENNIFGVILRTKDLSDAKYIRKTNHERLRSHIETN